MVEVGDDVELLDIVLHNDDRTPFEFVVGLLCDVFDFSNQDACILALSAHRQGKAIVVRVPCKTAEALLVKVRDVADRAGHQLRLTAVAPPLPTSVPSFGATRTAPDLRLFASIRHLLHLGARAFFFRHVSQAEINGHGAAVVAISLFAITIDIASSWLANGALSVPSTWGITSSVAGTAVFAGCLLLLRRRQDAVDVGPALSVVIAASALLTLLTLAAGVVWPHVIAALDLDETTALIFSFAAAFMPMVWWIAVLATLGGRIMKSRLRGSFGFVAAGLAAMLILPMWPVIATGDDGAGSSGLLSYAFEQMRPQQKYNTQFAERVDVEAAYARQPQLVEAALAGVLPSRKDRSELYFVSAGTYAAQDVFLREARSAREIFDDRMQTKGRSVLLVNNRQTLDELPLANATNLGAVMDRLAQLMDPEKDVLVLFLTSHGSEKRLSVHFSGFSFNDLTPERLSTLLTRSRIRNRVIVISACHAGSFIPAIEDKSTLVITASRADRTSFGCSNEREWTYFGDAYFNHALRRTRSLLEAFELARDKVSEWERRDKIVSSEPQISVGADIRDRLQTIARSLDQVDAVAQDQPGPLSQEPVLSR